MLARQMKVGRPILLTNWLPWQRPSSDQKKVRSIILDQIPFSENLVKIENLPNMKIHYKYTVHDWLENLLSILLYCCVVYKLNVSK